MATLNTRYDLFLVTFNSVTDQYVFEGHTSDQLGDLILTYGKHGIESIKRFDKSKSKFLSMNKKTVKQLFSWNTHTIEQLKKINFIK